MIDTKSIKFTNLTTKENTIMCYFNFLTGKAYKANSDIANILSDYCKKNAIAFTGFATIQQAKKLFYIVKKGSKGARCPIQIAGGKVHYFTLFPLSAFINAHDRRSLAAQKRDPNDDQHDQIIRYQVPAKISAEEKSALIATAASYSSPDSTTYILDKDDADRDMFKVSFDHRSESEFKHDQQLKQWIAEGNKAEDFDQAIPFLDHAYGTLTPEAIEKLNADVDQFCPF